MNPPILQEILATVPDDGTRVEDIQVYANWIISKAQRPAISTLFHGMPGLPPGPAAPGWGTTVAQGLLAYGHRRTFFSEC